LPEDRIHFPGVDIERARNEAFVLVSLEKLQMHLQKEVGSEKKQTGTNSTQAFHEFS